MNFTFQIIHSHKKIIFMAQLFSVNVYQFNSQDPVPLPSVSPLGIPYASVLIRGINGGLGQLLATGIRVYSQIQLIATGATMLAIETPASLVASS